MPVIKPVTKPDSSNNRKIIAVIKTPKNKKAKVASIDSLRDAWPRKKRVRVNPRRARQMSRLKRQRYARSRLLARRKPQQPKTKPPVLTKPGLTKPGLTKPARDHTPSSPTAPTKRDLGQPHKDAQSDFLLLSLHLPSTIIPVKAFLFRISRHYFGFIRPLIRELQKRSLISV